MTIIEMKDKTMPDVIHISMRIGNDNRTVYFAIRDNINRYVIKSFDQHFRNRDAAECTIEAVTNILTEMGGEVISE